MPRLKSKHYECPTPPEERGRAALLKFIARNTGRNLEYTQAALAAKIGGTPNSFSQKMNGRAKFSYKDIARIIDVLEPSDEEILSFLGRIPQKRRKEA